MTMMVKDHFNQLARFSIQAIHIRTNLIHGLPPFFLRFLPKKIHGLGQCPKPCQGDTITVIHCGTRAKL